MYDYDFKTQHPIEYLSIPFFFFLQFITCQAMMPLAAGSVENEVVVNFSDQRTDLPPRILGCVLKMTSDVFVI